MEMQENVPQDAVVNSGTVQKNDEKTMAVFAHAGGILFGFLPALIIWLMKKEESPYLAKEAKEALNFQLFIAMCMCICLVLVFVLIGALLIWFVWLADLIFCILAAVKVSDGGAYRYPVTIRFIK